MWSEGRSAPRPAFAGKVALVAGASRGIGAVVARRFAEAGAAVVLAARDAAAVEAAAEALRGRGVRALAVRTDVGDDASVRRLVERTLQAFGRLDVAMNNASDLPRPAPLAEVEPEEFDRGIRTNVRGTFLCMRHEIPAMLQSGGGAIVNVASLAGLEGFPGLAAYVAGKAAIVGLTKVAALDYANRGIRANVVAPGAVLTDHLQRAGEEAQRQAARSTPMGRIGRPEDVAATVLWLCSDEASFVTGAIVPIDGGQHAGRTPPRVYRPGEPMRRP